MFSCFSFFLPFFQKVPCVQSGIAVANRLLCRPRGRIGLIPPRGIHLSGAGLK